MKNEERAYRRSCIPRKVALFCSFLVLETNELNETKKLKTKYKNPVTREMLDIIRKAYSLTVDSSK